MEAAGITVLPDDLARVVDAVGNGASDRSRRQRIIESGVSPSVIEEAVVACVGAVIPDNLARRIDAGCKGAEGGQRIVEGKIIGAKKWDEG